MLFSGFFQSNSDCALCQGRTLALHLLFMWCPQDSVTALNQADITMTAQEYQTPQCKGQHCPSLINSLQSF